MALLALAGVFAVYRLQQNSFDLDLNVHRLGEYVQFKFATNIWIMQELSPYCHNIEGLNSQIERFSDPLSTVNSTYPSMFGMIAKDQYYKQLVQENENLKDRRTTLVSGMKLPFGLTLSVIIISLALLSFAHFIHLCVIEWIPISILTLLNVYALWQTKNYVFKVLKEE
jgi:hypothetical protein